MNYLGRFFALALLLFSLVTSQALAESGKGKMGDLDRAFNSDKMDRALDKEMSGKNFDRDMDDFDAAKINEQFTKELKDLKEDFSEGDIDRGEFDKKAADLKADFLKDIGVVGRR
jgi:hypothetical protein